MGSGASCTTSADCDPDDVCFEGTCQGEFCGSVPNETRMLCQQVCGGKDDCNGDPCWVGPCDFTPKCHECGNCDDCVPCGNLTVWARSTFAHAIWDLQKELRCCSSDGADDFLAGCADEPFELCTTSADCSLGQSCVDRPTEELFAAYLSIAIDPGLPHIGPPPPGPLVQMLLADDDDGDLTSTPPTPHYQMIYDAFVGLHGWDPYTLGEELGEVKVTWLGPPNISLVPGDDYVIDYRITPPNVTLITTEKELVPVVRWQLSRTDPETGGSLDIGQITTGWDGDAHDIEVHVGTESGRPVRSVSNLDIASEDPDQVNPETWSSILLNLDGNIDAARVVSKMGGAGGRISGIVRGSANGLDVAAIGVGAATNVGDSVSIGGSLALSVFNSFPSGAILQADAIDGDVTIQGEFDGTIELCGDLGDPQGEGTLTIAGMGTSSGDIHIGGQILGSLSIAGTFTGSICAAGLSFDSPELSGITFGVGATVCGVARCSGAGDCDDGDGCTTDTCDINTGWCNYVFSTSPSCDAPAPAAAAAPHDVKKNRYISFEPNNAGRMVAFRVTITAGPGAVAEIGWVGEPDPVSGFFGIERRPVYRNWTESVIHVTGCQIVPVATYEIESLRQFDDIASGEYSFALEALTIDKPGVKYWGDTVGIFNGTEWTAPQGTVNIDDAFGAIKTFQQEAGTGFPHVTRTDVAPDVPDGITNIADVFWILGAFRGDPYPFDDPADCSGCFSVIGDRAKAPPGGPVVFSLTVSDTMIAAEECVTVDTFISDVADLAISEFALQVVGGTTGTLDLNDLNVDTNRQDFAYGALSVMTGECAANCAIGTTLTNGGGVSVDASNGYLGSVILCASTDAQGIFEVLVREGQETYLSDGNGELIASVAGSSVFIGVGVACVADTDCGDSNPCTDDTCNNGTCVYTDDDSNSCSDENDCTDDVCISGTCVSTNDDTNTCSDGNDCTADSCLTGVCTSTNDPVNTPCDDGLFCTKTDKCDGAGVCVGTGDPCVGHNPECCEQTDTCGPLPCT